MSFEVITNRASEWLNNWKESFVSIKPDTSSLKTLIYLTLLEKKDEPLSYQNIADELKRRGLVEGEVDLVALRNGMYQIVNALKTDRYYEIEKRKNGKESSYLLKERSQAGLKNKIAQSWNIVRVLNDPDLVPSTKFVAENLMKNHRMPFYGIYLQMRAVARWVLYSEKEAQSRSKYESEECERLLKEWLSKYHGKEISVVGLGVGEGIGEIEILEKLLDKERKPSDEKHGFTRIHYCAIDTSDHLLLDHFKRLKDRFENEIKEGKLVCGIICGNFLENFPNLIKRLRTEFVENGYFDSEEDFLPNTSGTLVTILGNVLGNLEKRASEGSYLQPAIEEFKGYDLAFLLGVSTQQVEQKQGEMQIVQENYRRDLEDLLLATPRYLTHEVGILKSERPESSKEAEEFILPIDRNEKEERWPPLEQVEYQGEGQLRGLYVKGQIYEFNYITKWDLTMSVDGEEARVKAGTSLTLYNIIKFDKDSLVDFLVTSKNLYKPRGEINPGAINSGDEKRSYVMIALTNTLPE